MHTYPIHTAICPTSMQGRDLFEFAYSVLSLSVDCARTNPENFSHMAPLIQWLDQTETPHHFEWVARDEENLKAILFLVHVYAYGDAFRIRMETNTLPAPYWVEEWSEQGIERFSRRQTRVSP